MHVEPSSRAAGSVVFALTSGPTVVWSLDWLASRVESDAATPPPPPLMKHVSARRQKSDRVVNNAFAIKNLGFKCETLPKTTVYVSHCQFICTMHRTNNRTKEDSQTSFVDSPVSTNVGAGAGACSAVKLHAGRGLSPRVDRRGAAPAQAPPDRRRGRQRPAPSRCRLRALGSRRDGHAPSCHDDPQLRPAEAHPGPGSRGQRASTSAGRWARVAAQHSTRAAACRPAFQRAGTACVSPDSTDGLCDDRLPFSTLNTSRTHPV